MQTRRRLGTRPSTSGGQKVWSSRRCWQHRRDEHKARRCRHRQTAGKAIAIFYCLPERRKNRERRPRPVLFLAARLPRAASSQHRTFVCLVVALSFTYQQVAPSKPWGVVLLSCGPFVTTTSRVAYLVPPDQRLLASARVYHTVSTAGVFFFSLMIPAKYSPGITRKTIPQKIQNCPFVYHVRRPFFHDTRQIPKLSICTSCKETLFSSRYPPNNNIKIYKMKQISKKNSTISHGPKVIYLLQSLYNM